MQYYLFDNSDDGDSGIISSLQEIKDTLSDEVQKELLDAGKFTVSLHQEILDERVEQLLNEGYLIEVFYPSQHLLRLHDDCYYSYEGKEALYLGDAKDTLAFLLDV